MQYINDSKLPLFEGFCRKNQIDGKEIVATISGNKVKLKVAAKEETKAKGYMHGDEPDDDEGMLFVYEMDVPLQFWMKNVDFPLDILFFNSNFELVDYYTMDPYDGESDDEIKRYESKKPAMYAVELKAGWFDKNKIKDDCKLRF